MAIAYRREIDGLRALAVLAVVIFHAKPTLHGEPLLPGGFLGVDIFFVISGYLITAIILRELDAGTFTVSSFYHRRARRILPALFLVLLASLPVAWWLTIPEQLKSFSGSALATLLFSSNFWFWFEDSYWAGPSELKPLLHTWTLSLEEQFYILFPLLLIFLWRYARHRILLVLTVLFLVSLLLSQVGASAFKDANFFLLPTRAWELMAGALLATIEIARGRRPTGLSATLCPPLGLCLILGALLTFSGEATHPSLLTLLPVLGVCLVIWFARHGEAVTSMLSHRLLVGIGLISYALYLWHYPVFAFWRIRHPELSNLAACGLMLASLLLSVMSYWLIERPARSSKIVPLTPFAVGIGASAAALVVMTSSAYVTDGFAYRYGSLAEFFTETGAEAMDDPTSDEAMPACDGYDPFCAAELARGSIFLVGDSHAGVLKRPVSSLAKRYGYAFYKRNLGSCPQIDVASVVFDDCNQYGKETLELIAKAPQSIIIYAVHWRKYQDRASSRSYRGSITPYEGESLREAYERTFQTWIDLGHRLIIVQPGIETEQNIKEMVKEIIDPVPEADREQYLANLKIDLDYTQQVERADWEREFIADLAEKDDILAVDPLDIFCGSSRKSCAANEGKTLFILDKTHYSSAGTEEIIGEIENMLLNEHWITTP